MSIAKEILEFNQFNNEGEIIKILELFEDKNSNYQHMFDFACIKKEENAAIYIYTQGLKDNVEWNFISRLKLAIKYNNKKLIGFLLNQNIDFSSHKVDLIKYSIDNEESYAIVTLFSLFNYEKDELIDLYDYAFDKYCYTAIEQIILLDQSLNSLKIEEINYTLHSLYFYYIEYSEEEINFICYLFDLGGNTSLFNNSVAVLYMILDKEFEKAAKLLLKGVTIQPDNSAIYDDRDEYNSLLNESVEELEQFKKYLQIHYPNNNVVINYN